MFSEIHFATLVFFNFVLLIDFFKVESFTRSLMDSAENSSIAGPASQREKQLILEAVKWFIADGGIDHVGADMVDIAHFLRQDMNADRLRFVAPLILNIRSF